MNIYRANKLGITSKDCEILTNPSARPLSDPWIVRFDGRLVTAGDIYYVTQWVASLRRLEVTAA